MKQIQTKMAEVWCQILYGGSDLGAHHPQDNIRAYADPVGKGVNPHLASSWMKPDESQRCKNKDSTQKTESTVSKKRTERKTWHTSRNQAQENSEC